jgi:phenylacetate-CoA ligase
METEGIQPHYQIIVDRKGPLDDIEVMVEVDEKFFSDEIKVLEKLSHDIQQKIKNTLGLSAKITLVEPMKIARSEGKAIRVVDKRK